MEPTKIEFIYKSQNIDIYCSKNEIMKDIIKKFCIKVMVDENSIYCLYSGIVLDKNIQVEKLIQDKNKNETISILVYNQGEQKENKIVNVFNSPQIICPECQDIASIRLNKYKISINCKNNHFFNNIFLKDFEKGQKIDESKIICDNCRTNNKSISFNRVFFICLNCKKNLCPLCKPSHNKKYNNHIFIKYEQKNFVCFEHGENYSSYCYTCKKNLCIACEVEHSGHNLLSLGKLFPNKNDLNKRMSDLKENINKLKNEINNLIELLNEFIKNFDFYYKLNEDINNSFNIKSINYEILSNIKEINNNNEIFDDIKRIINGQTVFDKFKCIFYIYNIMNTKENIICNILENKFFNNININNKNIINNNFGVNMPNYNKNMINNQPQKTLLDMKKAKKGIDSEIKIESATQNNNNNNINTDENQKINNNNIFPNKIENKKERRSIIKRVTNKNNIIPENYFQSNNFINHKESHILNPFVKKSNIGIQIENQSEKENNNEKEVSISQLDNILESKMEINPEQNKGNNTNSKNNHSLSKREPKAVKKEIQNKNDFSIKNEINFQPLKTFNKNKFNNKLLNFAKYFAERDQIILNKKVPKLKDLNGFTKEIVEEEKYKNNLKDSENMEYFIENNVKENKIENIYELDKKSEGELLDIIKKTLNKINKINEKGQVPGFYFETMNKAIDLKMIANEEKILREAYNKKGELKRTRTNSSKAKISIEEAHKDLEESDSF